METRLLLLPLLALLLQQPEPSSCSSPPPSIRHPSLATEEVQYGIVDASDWHASFTTSVRGLDDRLSHHNSLRLLIQVDNLPDRNNFQLDLSLRCQPAAPEQQLQYILPFTFHGETLCDGVMPFTVTSTQSTWLTGPQQQLKYSLILSLKRVPNSADVAFSQTLSHSVRLGFSLHNAQWKLEASSIYLWSLDSAFKLNDKAARPGASYPRYFLTDAALDLMLHMKLASSDPFGSVQFIDPALVQLVGTASEYAQNYVNIEAIMLLGIGIASDCHTSKAEYTLVFSTRKAGVIEEQDKMMKVAQLDAATGRLSYSRYGLSSAMERFYRENRKQINSHHRPEDYRLRICAGIELAHSLTPVSAFKTVELLLDPKLKYQALGSRQDDCQIVGPSVRRVTLFARSGQNRLICPIICSNIEEPYLFYRGRIALTPSSRYDRTHHINGSIAAHKAGTVIDIRDDLTHEDAGEYSCTAGGQTVAFQVSVVSLPSFSARLLSGHQLIGSLPARIYAVEGEGYRVSCTVHFAGVKAVTLVPEFYLKFDSPDGKFHWTKTSADAFIEEAQADGSRCEAALTESSSAHSKSWTLTVRGVRREGRQWLSFFDHRLACTAGASAEDAGRLGLADFSARTGSDVLFVDRPRADSFEAALSRCCLEEASCGAGSPGGQWCTIDVWLKSSTLDYLTSIGVTIGGSFELGGAPYSGTGASFDPAAARASVRVAGPLSKLAEAARSDLVALRPLFRYQFATDAAAKSGASFTVLRGPESDAAGDRLCVENPSCLFSTGFDRRLSSSLTLISVIAGQINATSGSLPPWLLVMLLNSQA